MTEEGSDAIHVHDEDGRDDPHGEAPPASTRRWPRTTLGGAHRRPRRQPGAPCRARPATIVSLVDGRIKAVDGPFAEAKELVGGYAVIDVRSREEAVELGRRLMQIHLDNWPGWEGSVEIRQIAEF